MIAMPSSSTATMNVSRNWPKGIMGRMSIGGWRLEAGGWRLEAGGWKLDGGAGELETGNWELDAGSCSSLQRFPTLAPARMPGIGTDRGSAGANAAGAESCNSGALP